MKCKRLTTKQKDILFATLIGVIGLTIMLLLCTYYSIRNNSFSDFFSLLRKLDAYHYNYITNYGYDLSSTKVDMDMRSKGLYNGMAVWAFFPLYPLLVSILKTITFGLIDTYFLGVFLSTVFMGVMVYFLIQFFREKNIKINYILLSALFVFNTFFMFYFNFYTEAIYMMIVAIFLYLCEKKKFFASGITLAFLSATRVTGAFFVFYLLYKIYNEIQIENKQLNKIKTFFAKIWQIIKNPYYLASLSVSLIGLAIFILVLAKVYNLSPLAFLDTQVGWGKQNKLPGYYIIYSLIYGIDSQRIIAVFLIISIIFCIYLMVKEKKYFIPIFTLLYIIFITISSINSADRYLWDFLLLTIEFYSLLMNKQENYIKANNTKKKTIWNIFIVMTILIVVTICVIAVVEVLFKGTLLFC